MNKQIEEMAKAYKRLTNNNRDEYNPEYDFCIGCKDFGEPNGCNRWNGACANYERFIETYERLEGLEDKIENGILKEIPENAVVMTKEEHKQWLKDVIESNKAVEETARKETAKEILQIIKSEYGYIGDLEKVIEVQYGVEVE